MNDQMPYPSLEARVESAVTRARQSGDGCAVIVLDIDRFGELSERLGQLRGDEVLASVEKRLSKHVRADDTAVRISGNTFAVVLNGINNWKDAARTARAIARGFERPFPIGYLDVRISASIGVASFPYAADDATELLQLAIAKMHLVKRNGGYGILNATPRDEVAVRRRLRRLLPREETAARVHENAACATSFRVRRQLHIAVSD